MAITYATWNPSDKDADMTLSGGNLTASGAGSGWASVRSTIGVSSGKWYWEYTFTGAATTTGIANATATLNNYCGADANGWGYYDQDGSKINNSSFVGYGATFAAGDVMAIALDMDAGTVAWYKNNSSQGTAFTGLTGTIYAMGSLANNGLTFTANFGATALTYTPPSGYNAGLYTGSADTSGKNFLMFM